ncbi:MAG TPA: translocation/assembly module TamB domain-containing protein [Bryobacteraceae bacterium]|jgi:translocation and assembly module TamB|nr:translocation/assembly module TamB domain-containing protein [Bryobacteraceae bacterium]
MTQTLRVAARVAALVGGAAALIFALALYTLQTNWFKQRVREKIVAAAEQATGGRVELGTFNYDWRTLDAEFDAFVVHGSEPADAPPLFRANSIRAGLRIVSLIQHDVDIKFLKIDRPKINLIVHPDGSTNLPRATAARTAPEFVDALFSLKVDRFEIDDGQVETNAQRYPLSVRGNDLQLLLARNRRAAQYEVSLAVHNLQCDSKLLQGWAGDVAAKMRLEGDRLWLDDFAFAAPGARLHANGSLIHFENPVADIHVDGRMEASGIGKLAGMAALEGGEAGLSGAMHYSAGSPVSFTGKAWGRKLAYRFDGASVHEIDFDSAVVAREDAVSFSGLAAGALGGRVVGEALVKRNGEAQFTGKFFGLNVREISEMRGGDRLPFNGTASGTLHLAGTLGKHNFTLESVTHIAPAASGAPIAGDVDLSYRQLGDELIFGDSHVSLPHTQIAFSGTAGQTLRLTVDSTDLNELNAVLGAKDLKLPVINANGSVHFDGTVGGSLAKAYVQGNLTAAQLQFRNLNWRQLRAHINAAEGGVDFSSLTVNSGALHVSGSGHAGLAHWRLGPKSAVRLRAKFQGADLERISSGLLPARLQILRGVGAGSVDLSGTLDDPRGSVHLRVDNLDAYGQPVNTVEMDASVESNGVRITQGKMQAGPAVLSFSGSYQHPEGSWEDGRLAAKADSNGFPLAGLAAVRNHEPGLQAQIEIHAQATAKVTAEHVEPVNADGRLTLRGIEINSVPYGSMALGVATRGQLMEAHFSGDLRETHVSGAAQAQLAAGLPASGEVRLNRISLATLYALAMPNRKPEAPLNGFVEGGFTFSGPLEHFDQMRASVRLDQAELKSGVPVSGENGAHAAELVFRNAGPVVVDAVNGIATIRSLEIQGKDTALSVRGSIPYVEQRAIDLNVGGSADLRLVQFLDPDVQSSGQSSLAMSVSGTLANPAVQGTLRLKNGAFSLNGVPNGLTGVNGALNFDRNRATLEDLTAQTGGGRVSLTGFVTYGTGGPLSQTRTMGKTGLTGAGAAEPARFGSGFVYRLQGRAENVRMRYGGSGSVTSDADLQLTGTSKNSVLSGTVKVSRVAFNANTDVGALLASIAAPAPANEQDFLTGLQLDLRIESAPNLQLSTALSRDVEADVDLRLRGTLNHPVLLGSISADQGDIKVFGTKYSINRAQVTFLNPVKIEPVLDLDLQTRARGVIVDITIAGTPGKLNINYRSDPPLQPHDIIALLTVGRAPSAGANVPTTESTNDVSALEPGANTVLGAAVSPNSSRLQKLFGVANIKIDPMVQGITNTMQRLTIEQQISRDITVTYVTNLSQTSEQIFRLEWAFSQQYSVVALRDDNGEFGIDLQYKKRFK